MTSDHLKIRPLVEDDLTDADRIMRVAFGTFIGLPDPAKFMGDAAYVQSRWRANRTSAFAAEVNGRLIGSNLATRWGSFGFFGPLSVDPEFWGRGLAGALMKPVLEAFSSWKVTHAGLFTFAESPKHIGLYQKFGFRPRSLTVILEKTIDPNREAPEGLYTYSQLDERRQSDALAACRHLTDEIYPGLDVTSEIESIHAQSLGDTVLLRDVDLVGFAACHSGAGSEAGSGVCYLKFGAVVPGPGARERFGKLLQACETFAGRAGVARIVAGMSADRGEAYDEMLLAGFRIALLGTSMHRPNEPGWNRPDVFVIDDWR
jgi:GNAT superfamily N-acetyltransferase